MENNDPTNDTHPDQLGFTIKDYRNMSPSRKLEIVCELTHIERQRILSEVRRDYPAADEWEQKLRMATRIYGPEIMLRMFGWDAEKEGYRGRRWGAAMVTTAPITPNAKLPP